MNIKYMVTSAIVRRLVYVALALLLGWVGIGRAEAATFLEAWATCEANKAADGQTHCAASGTTAENQKCVDVGVSSWVRAKTDCRAPAGHITQTNANTAGVYFYSGSNACPAGTSKDATTGECKMTCPDGYAKDPANPTQCMDSDKCKALNNSPGFNSSETRAYNHAAGVSSHSFCPANQCKMGRSYGGETTCAGGQCVTYGTWSYTGASCSVGVGDPTFSPTPPQDITDPNKPQLCVPAGENLTYCVKPTGEQCHTSSNGKQNCWKTGETGTKTSENVLQKRDAGTEAIAPPLILPSGDTLVKQTQPSVVVTTTTNMTGDNRTTTTNTSNYTTVNGTNAAPDGGTGTGTNSDGSAGDGNGEDEGNTSTGGLTCVAPPTSTGDPLLSMVAHQQWLLRCRGAGDENGDGVPDFLNETLDDDNGDGIIDGQTGWMDENGEPEILLDELGFGLSRSCPQPPTISLGGYSKTIDTSGLCDLAGMIGLLIFAAGMAQAAYIIAGNK